MKGLNPRFWDWKRLFGVVCLCVPTVAVVVLGAWFMVDRVPNLIRDEHRRVLAEYRLVAVEVQSRTNELARIALGKGWKPAGKMKPGRWGVEVGSSGKAYVWYEDGTTACGTETEAVDETDFGTIFWIAGTFVLLLLSCMTAFGVKFFVDYVQSRDDFLAATAHDLSTPLVGMRGAIGRSDADAKVLVERMLRLVENLKAFLRLGGRRPAPAKEVFDGVEAVREAYGLFAADYAEEASGEVEFSGEGRVLVEADRTAVVQIAWNLLGNDLKYAAPFGKVTVGFSLDGGMARVEFADEGPGMAAYEMRRAFDRYYRAKTVLESGKGGFGIGLCNARESAAAMGGSLSVRANVPHGCVFTLLLPLAKGQEGAE